MTIILETEHGRETYRRRMAEWELNRFENELNRCREILDSAGVGFPAALVSTRILYLLERLKKLEEIENEHNNN